MRIEIFRDKIELGEAQENFIREKIEHLAKHSERMQDEATFVRVDVVQNKIKTSDENVVVEVTIQVPHGLIRAESSGISMEEALRSVCEKLEVQVEKYKNIQQRRSKAGEWIDSSTLENISESQDEYSDSGVIVSKRKKLEELPIISEEEAINRMELLGHDFFIYRHVGDGKMHVIYKRRDESYGVIEVDEIIA